MAKSTAAHDERIENAHEARAQRMARQYDIEHGEYGNPDQRSENAITERMRDVPPSRVKDDPDTMERLILEAQQRMARKR